jgi:lipid A 3-O-deacylase PagL
MSSAEGFTSNSAGFGAPLGSRCSTVGTSGLVLLLSAIVCIGGSFPAGEEESGNTLEKAADSNDRYRKGTWDWDFEFAYLFSVVPNPWHCLIDLKTYDANVNDYKFVTQTLGLRYRLTDVVGPSFFRVSTQACADLVVTEIVKGPESYFFGSAFGLHFDFVERGWPVVPYLDFRIGPGGIDAAKGAHGQQSDFEFTYLWGAGLRYDISSTLSVSAGALDQHFSDAWLVHRNVSVDNVGVNIRLEKKF